MLDFILTVVGYGILALLGLALFFALLAAVLAALPIMLFGDTGLFLIGLPVYLMLQYSYWWGLILPPCWWLGFTVLAALDEPHTIKSDDETQ